LVKKIEINDIKETLGLGDKYKRFIDFKNRVLDPAKNQINKHSDIQISYEVIKAGRKPTEVKFTVMYKVVKKAKKTAPQTSQVEHQDEIAFDTGDQQPVTKTERSKAKNLLANAKAGIF